MSSLALRLREILLAKEKEVEILASSQGTSFNLSIQIPLAWYVLRREKAADPPILEKENIYEVKRSFILEVYRKRRFQGGSFHFVE